MKMLWLHVTFHNRFPFYCIEWIRILPISEIYCKILWTTRREWMQESDREEIYWERAMEWECRECWKSVTRKWTWLDSLRRIHVKKNREQAHSPRMKWVFMKYVIQYPEYFYRANIILWRIFVFTYWQFEQHFYCQRQQSSQSDITSELRIPSTIRSELFEVEYLLHRRLFIVKWMVFFALWCVC